jgi:phenylacetate-CoA ligase
VVERRAHGGGQRAQIELLYDHARAHVPAYADRLPSIRFDADDFDAQFARVPILRRVDLQRDAASLRASARPAGHQQPRSVSTSGSTGTSVSVDVSEAARLLWMAILLREHAWHARDLGSKHASIRLFGDGVDARGPHGLRRADWGPPENVVYETGPSSMLDISTDVDTQLDWLVAEEPDILLTFPSNALDLARRALQRDVALPRLRELRLVSEAVDPSVRAFLAEAWKVRVTDVYSAQEVGYIALQCPQGPGHHVQSENVRVEVVDEEGLACAPGQTGRVLVTALHSFAMPLIRYEIGDYAQVGPPCACGRGLPVLARILGRVRNMLELPDGKRRWPNLSGPFYRDIAPVVQHQIVQHAKDALEARLVVERTLSAAEEDALRALILRRIGHPFRLTFSYCEHIERGAGGKFEEFVSRLDAGASGAAR